MVLEKNPSRFRHDTEHDIWLNEIIKWICNWSDIISRKSRMYESYTVTSNKLNIILPVYWKTNLYMYMYFKEISSLIRKLMYLRNNKHKQWLLVFNKDKQINLVINWKFYSSIKRYEAIKLNLHKNCKLFNSEWNIDIIQMYMSTLYIHEVTTHTATPFWPKVGMELIQHIYKLNQLFF